MAKSAIIRVPAGFAPTNENLSADVENPTEPIYSIGRLVDAILSGALVKMLVAIDMSVFPRVIHACAAAQDKTLALMGFSSVLVAEFQKVDEGKSGEWRETAAVAQEFGVVPPAAGTALGNQVLMPRATGLTLASLISRIEDSALFGDVTYPWIEVDQFSEKVRVFSHANAVEVAENAALYEIGQDLEDAVRFEQLSEESGSSAPKYAFE